MANNNPNAWELCMFGFFTDYPAKEDVEKGVSFAHDKTGTLTGATYELPLDVEVKKDGEINIGVSIE